jgi:hypothetical protein
MNRFRIPAAALTALLFATGLLLSGCGQKKEENITQMFPPQLDNRIEFHQGNKDLKELVRMVQYAPDGKTPISAQIEYEAGKTGFVTYRTTGDAAGTISQVKIVYPPVAGKKDRQTARELALDLDGKTYLNDRVFRADGLLQYRGDRLANDRYETFDYQDDGVAIHRHQIFVRLYARWKVNLEELFRSDNTVDKSIVRMDDGSLVTTKFAEGSKPEWRSIRYSWSSSVETQYFEADGQTVNKKIAISNYDVVITNFVAGVKSEARRFYGNYNYMSYSVYDAAGQISRRQSWIAKTDNDTRTAGKIDPDKYRLTEVETYDAKGVNLRDVEFYPDGKTPKLITEHDPTQPKIGWFTPATIKTFRPDGTLSNLTVYDGQDHTTKKEDHTADENIRETVDPSDMAQHPFEEPPDIMTNMLRGWNDN